MKLIFPKRIRVEKVCSGMLSKVRQRVAKQCGAEAQAIIAEMEKMAAAAYAFEVQSASVGDYDITFEINRGLPWFRVARRVIARDTEVVNVADAAEALAVCKARSPDHGVTMMQAGRRHRADMQGNVYDVGTPTGAADAELANAVPVSAFFASRTLDAVLL